MTFPPDFADAHKRHFLDGEFLFKKEHWANADQLYGFSAECGLKSVMECLGMELDDNGIPAERAHRRHIQELWGVFFSFAENRIDAQYVRMLPNENPFNSWSHHNRYSNSSHFTKENTSPHRSGATKVNQMLEQARLDGICT